MTVFVWIKEHPRFVLGSVVSLLIAPIIVGFILNDNQLLQENKTAAIQGLIADLEKIKTLTPSNASLEECLQKSTSIEFDDSYESCFRKIKQNGEEARSLLERNRYPIKISFGEELFSKVQIYLDTIDYGLYEMNNNQLTIERWRNDNCADTVDFISVEEMRKRIPDAGEVKCSLLVQTQEQFLNSLETRSPCDPEYDCTSAISSGRQVGDEMVESFIVPGNTTSFSKHMAHSNSGLYADMLGFIDELLLILKNESGL